MSSTSTPSLQAEAFTAQDMERAFAAAKPAIDALSVEDCPPITADADLAAATVLAAVPHLALYEAQLRALPEIGESLTLLRPYALAVMHVQLRVRMGDRSAPSNRELEELMRMRETLLADLSPLVRRDIVDGEFMERLNVASGFRNTANDVLLLASVAERHWPSIGHRTAMTTEWVDAARKAATEMLSALVARDGRTRTIDPSGERIRAFTLLVRAYDEMRRGMTFLLWKKGDAAIEAVTPSIFRGRGGRGKSKEEGSEPEVVSPVVVNPVVVSPTPADPDKPAPVEGPGVRPF